jgi:signal transduction histidine kinase
MTMKKLRKTTGATGLEGPSKPFLQPLAIALVCMVFIVLVLIMGWMDLRNLDKTLSGYMEIKGLSIVKNTQLVAEDYFQKLTRRQDTGFDAVTSDPLTQDSFSLRESLIMELVAFIQEVDLDLSSNRINYGQLRSLCKEEKLWLMAFLDDRGQAIFKTRPVPGELLSITEPVIKGYQEIQVNIFNRIAGERGLGSISLRRKSGNGAILLTLDDEGFQYWSIKVSIQKAIEDVIQNSECTYFIVMDAHDNILGQFGKAPRDQKERPQIAALREAPGAVNSRKTMLDGISLLEIAVPIRLGSGFNGTARLSLKKGSIDKILKRESGRIFVSTAFLIVIAILSMWFLYRNQKRHLNKMQEMERQLHQAERLSAMGRLAAGVAHEIRNPLNAISMASQRLERDNIDRLTALMRDEIRRLNRIIEDFIGFAKTRKMEFSQHNVMDLLQEIVLLTEEESESKGIEIKIHRNDSPLIVSMDFDKLKQAVFNIFKNAMESISKGGIIELLAEPKGKDWISIRISDTGSGMTPEEIEKIFNPDYSTKDKGLGLGLTLAHEIVKGHGGDIQVRSQPGQGSTFEILLPGNINSGVSHQ